MKLCVLIPCYNEGMTIRSVVLEVKKFIPDVVVIDDGSTDNTGKEGEAGGAKVIRHEHNAGKGCALRTGFKYALDNGYDSVIVMDGDGQHAPSDIPRLLEEFTGNSGIDILIGNRMHDIKDMPFSRRITNIVMSRTISFLAGKNLPDTQSGFRFLRRRVLEEVKLSTQHYDTESEILLKALKQGFNVSSFPVSTIYRGEISYIHAIKDTLRFLKLVGKYVGGRI